MHTFKLITLALVLAPVAAQAQPQGQEAPTERVKISDLNLRSPAGRTILARRIDTAAENVCPPADPSTAFLSPAAIKCRAAVVREAQVQIAALAERGVSLAGR
ncbi:MAG: UrcA family protein [Sphingomonas sp.]